MVLENQLPGVLFAVYDSKTRTPEYIPPESCDIEPLMRELVEWYYKNDNLPVAIRAAIVHYAFVSIHPFNDGNGRTARALATYILMINDYDLKGFNSFEEYYMADLDGYYSSLQMGLPALFYDGRENPPHLEIWILFFCKIMALNAENIYLQAKEASLKENNLLLNHLTKKDLTLVRYFIENGIVSVKPKELSGLFGVSSRAVSKWMKEWVYKEILIPYSGTKRITAYRLNEKYAHIRLEDLGYIE